MGYTHSKEVCCPYKSGGYSRSGATLGQAGLHPSPIGNTSFRLICNSKPSHVCEVSVYLSLDFQSAVGPAGPCGSKSLHKKRPVSRVLGGRCLPIKNHDLLIEPVSKYASSGIATTYLYTFAPPSFFTVSCQNGLFPFDGVFWMVIPVVD